MPLTIPEYLTVKTAAGATAAYLSPEADGLKDVVISNDLNSQCTLTLSLPLMSDKWLYLSSFFRIYAPDITGNMREFVILNPDAIEKSRDGKKLWGKITAHESWVLLGKKYADPGISNDPQTPSPPALAVVILSGGSDLSGGAYTPGSAGHALYALLQGTGWSIGTVDVTGTHDLETEKISILANINKLQEIWGGYLVWDSLNKTVSLRDEESWAPYTGYQVRYGKNLKGITRTEDTDIVTKLYPFGADDLNIGSVNGGQIYLTNNSYTTDVLEGIWVNQDIADPQELKIAAEKHLAHICKPRYNYRVKQVDLRTLSGYQHEDFDIGHLVDIVDEEVTSQVYGLQYDAGYQYDTGLFYADWFRNQTRIIGYKHNVFQPWRGEIEVGDPIEKIEAMLQQGRSAASYLDKIKNSKDQITGTKLVDESIITQKIANAAVDATKMDAKVIILMGDEWTDNDPSAGYVSWNQHKLYYGGKEYNINSGNTNQKYIYWDGASNNYSFQGVEPDLADGQFYIAVNNAGLHDLVWNSPTARKFIGSLFIGDAAILTAHIADLAVTDAKIANITANKIIAATLSAITANLGTVTAGDLYSVKFRSGGQSATSYVEIDAGNSPIKVIENNKTALRLWTATNFGYNGGSGGAIEFRDTGVNSRAGYITAFHTLGGGDEDRGLFIAAEDDTGHERQVFISGSIVGVNAAGSVIFKHPTLSNAVSVRILGDLHVTEDLSCGGAKPAIHKTISYGRRAMYARESPNLKFIEETVSRLTVGECKIELDPVFLETIEPHTEKTPWTILCTPYADIGLYVAEIGKSYFVIRERSGGTSDSQFAWSMSAFREGFADIRMEEYVEVKGKGLMKSSKNKGAEPIDSTPVDSILDPKESLSPSDQIPDSKLL